MSSRGQKPVKVQLVGGLGNQLFGYFAGKYLSALLNVHLLLDMSHLELGLTAHKSDIRAFNIDATVIVAKRESLLRRCLNFFLVGFAHRVPLARIPVEKMMQRHTSRFVGVDPCLEKVAPGMEIRGYFQTYRYVDEVLRGSRVTQLALKEPSSWFISMAEEAKNVPTIMMHVRRGDYARPENANFGMLSASYYATALSQLRDALGSDNQVWVFSDEIDMVRYELDGHIQGNITFIEPPAGTVAAESMMLMSLGAGIIISNSTFSWWSAILNPDAKVVAPTRWFKAKEDPEDLIPGSWLRQESVWK